MKCLPDEYLPQAQAEAAAAEASPPPRMADVASVFFCLAVCPVLTRTFLGGGCPRIETLSPKCLSIITFHLANALYPKWPRVTVFSYNSVTSNSTLEQCGVGSVPLSRSLQPWMIWDLNLQPLALRTSDHGYPLFSCCAFLHFVFSETLCWLCAQIYNSSSALLEKLGMEWICVPLTLKRGGNTDLWRYCGQVKLF